MTQNPDSRAIPLLAFAAFAGLALLLVWTKHYPSGFDELEHVAYVAHLQETHEWRPMFEAMLDLPVDSLTHWDTRPNYLGHPGPFYWYETMFLDRSLPLGAAILRVRLASAALASAGIALALWAGWRVFGRDRLALLVFATLAALSPKLLATTGQVTNDALAILAGGLAYWGVCTEARHRNAGLLACGMAIMLALWAKPNAALAVGAVLGFYTLLRLRERPSLALVLTVGAVVGSVPYWFILAKYGALVPITVEQFGGVRSVPGLAYIPAFLFTVAYTFCFDQTGTWPIPGLGAVLAAALVWALLAMVLAGGVMALRDRGRAGTSAARLIAIAAPLAFLAVLPIHLGFSLTKLAGSLPAASFRYYLPIWPFMAHAIAYAITGGSAALRWTIVALAAAALAVGWVSP